MTVSRWAHAVALGNAAAARPVEPDRMHLVEIGHRPVRLGDVAQLGDRRDVAVHRIDRFERDQFRHGGIERGELAVEVGGVVMRESLLCRPAVPDALDHRGVVQFIGQHDAARQPRRERAQRRPVRHVAGVEQQRGFGAVQIGQLAFEHDVVMVGAGDVPGAAGAGAATVDRRMHRRQHLRVLAHAEIVVGAPYRHLATAVAAIVHRPREMPGPAFEIGKDAIASLAPQFTQLPLEKSLVIHDPPVPRFMPGRPLTPPSPPAGGGEGEKGPKAVCASRPARAGSRCRARPR